MPAAPLHIMLVAGEPSGDALGARLMASLRAETVGEIRFSGVGGQNMTGEGLESLFPLEDLSVMGIAEVLPRLPLLLRRIRETAAAATTTKPDALVTVDSPGFTLRVAGRLKGQGIPLIHYVAPQVWAWRPGRAKHIAQVFDRLLALLPFEPPLFEAVGLPCDFVGHSVVEEALPETEAGQRGSAFRAEHGISGNSPLLAVLPGSRRSEIERLLPVFGETVERLAERHPNLHVVVPTLRQIEGIVREAVREWHSKVTVVATSEERGRAFAAADAALAASGTVSLELAAARVPTVIAYRMNPISAWIGRRVIRVPWISLSNIILERPLIPELFQQACRPEVLEAEVHRILTDQAVRSDQQAGADEVMKALGLGQGMAPSRRAAQAVLAAIGHRP
jgi:lipid-A-disaccharide synthase